MGRPAALGFLALSVLATAAAAGEPARSPATAEDDAVQSERQSIMDRNLPFRDGQILVYFGPDGGSEGYAVRHRLTIRFYSADGTYLGRAERVSEEATRYFDAGGLYLGRRLHQKLVR